MNTRFVTVIIMVLALGRSVAAGQSAVKLGHIDFDAVVSSLPETDSIAGVMEKEKKEAEDVYEEMMVVYNNLVADYQKGLPGFSELVRSSKEADILDKQKRIRDFEMQAESALVKRQNELMMPVYKKVVDAIEAVAGESGFTYIIDINRSGIVFKSKESIDISDLVKAKLGV